MVDYKDLDLPQKKSFFAPATIIKRLIAFFIDLFIINFFIASPFVAIIERVIPAQASGMRSYEWIMSNPDMTAPIYFSIFFITILSLLYFSLMESKLGQTVGKMFLNIYVIKLPDISSLDINKKDELIDEKGKKKTSKTSMKSNKISNLKMSGAHDIRLNMLTALIRNLFIIPFFPFIILWILEPIYLMNNKNNQRLLEKLTNTMTIEMMTL